jgi:hypothetical protein
MKPIEIEVVATAKEILELHHARYAKKYSHKLVTPAGEEQRRRHKFWLIYESDIPVGAIADEINDAIRGTGYHADYIHPRSISIKPW